MKMTKEWLAKEIKSAVEWLKENEEGCSTIKLDERLAVCVGWSDGFDEDDETIIHSKIDPAFAINAGIKVWTSDDLRTDFDWISSPYHENGEVWDDDCSISPNKDYAELAQFFLDEYATIAQFDIDDDGKIIGHKNMWVCKHCLMAIESREGNQATLTHSVDEDNENESTCEWCHESGFDTLYELI